MPAHRCGGLLIFGGIEFFAKRRLLRWLPERRVQAALDERDRRALERLCSRLPDVVPPRPACLTHGDLWANNILATEDGLPALIDPAVSYTWADVDLAHLWCSPHPPEAKRFFEGLSYSNKRRLVIPIEDAKAAETRQRRIEKTVSMLHEGRS